MWSMWSKRRMKQLQMIEQEGQIQDLEKSIMELEFMLRMLRLEQEEPEKDEETER